MGRCCPICYKVGVGEPQLVKEVGLAQGRFFQLFNRYLEGEAWNNTQTEKQQELFQWDGEFGMIACAECFKLMESFGEMYHQLKTLELRLNWKVQTLKNIMKGAQRVPSRVKYFRDCIRKRAVVDGSRWRNEDEMVDSLNKSRKSLVTKCSRKLKGALPKLCIENWKFGKDAAVEPVGTVARNRDDSPKRSKISSKDGGVHHRKEPETDEELLNTVESATIPAPTLKDVQTSGAKLLLSYAIQPIPRDGHDAEKKEGEEDNRKRKVSATDDTSSKSPQGLKRKRYNSTGSPTKCHEQGEVVEQDNGCSPRNSSEEGLLVRATVAIKKEWSQQLEMEITEKKNNQPETNDNHEDAVEWSDIAASDSEDSMGFGLSSAEVEDGNSFVEVQTESKYSVPLDPVGDSRLNDGVKDDKKNDKKDRKKKVKTQRKGERHLRSGLRNKHSCQKCKKTFSSLENMKDHEKEAHRNNNREDVDSDDGDCGASGVGVTTKDMDDDFNAETTNACLSPSSEEDQEDSDSDHSLHQKSWSKSKLSKSRASKIYNKAKSKLSGASRIYNKWGSIPEKYSRRRISRPKPVADKYRLKCPDCSNLFEDVEALLIHRKDSDCCKSFYDPVKSVRVEVMEQLSKIGDGGNGDVNSVVLAVVDLPQAIFTCEECRLSVYSPEDAEYHKRLHDTFTCSVCPVQLTNAPNMALHELQHSSRKGKKSKRDGGSYSQCHRCDFKWKDNRSGHWKNIYVNHYLKIHLSLTLPEPKCSICKTTRVGSGQFKLGPHFKTLHDLNSPTAKSGDLKRCTESNCGAYFLTGRQLLSHRLMRHDLRKREEMYQCKDCDRRFASPPILRKHRLKYHVDPEKAIPCPFEDCTYTFESKENLEGHLLAPDTHKQLVIKSVKDVQCPTCGVFVDGSDPSHIRTHMKTHFLKNNHAAKDFRLKCPDCLLLFPDIRTLLLHRRDSCGAPSCDPSSSIIVEVLISEIKEKDLTDSDFSTVHALIELPLVIFLCDICDLALYSAEDMEAHQNHHGSFRCHFCNIEKCYAPELAKHELQHNTQELQTDLLREQQHCPRCNGRFSNKHNYIDHHLSTHLTLTVNKPLCPICKTIRVGKETERVFGKAIRRRLLAHLKSHHDISSVLNTEEDVIRCAEGSCNAYFLQRAQLSEHKMLRHASDNNLQHGVGVPLLNNVKPEPGMGKRSSLGSTSKYKQRCHKCKNTFSTLEGLEGHKQEAHLKTRSRADKDKDPVSEMAIDEEEDINTDSSSSEGEEEYSEQTLEKITSSDSKSDSKAAGNEELGGENEVLKDGAEHYNPEVDANSAASSEEPEEGPRPSLQMGAVGTGTEFIKYKQSYQTLISSRKPVADKYRLKCPDCSNLLEDVEAFLIHRKNDETCKSFYDPAKSVRVEVLELSKTDGDANSVVLAVVDLPQAIFTCGECHLSVYTPEDMEAHRKFHDTFSCTFCPVQLTNAPNMALHEIQHTAKGKRSKDAGGHSYRQCPRCDSKWRGDTNSHWKGPYIRHFLKAHLSLTLQEPKCSICKTTPAAKAFNLGQHFKAFHDLSSNPTTTTANSKNIKRCKVNNCDAYFLTNKQLTSHRLMHHNLDILDKKYKCADCEESFTLPSNLRRHRLKRHVDPEKAISCPFKDCPYLFESKKNLAAHLFASETHKRLVIKTVRDVQCPTCGVFVDGRDPKHIRSHMRTNHRKDRMSFVCDSCGKACASRDALKLHTLSHLGPESWEFMCSVCSKKCLTRQHLTDHMRIHTKEKPFVCQVCGEAYGNRQHLRLHVNRKHGDVTQDIPKKRQKTNALERGERQQQWPRKRTKRDEGDGNG